MVTHIKSFSTQIQPLNRLGGYAKIGWPGIIIIEGEENDCNKFVDEIRTMRWQHLAVRGEEQVAVMSSRNEDLDALRKFPLQFEELSEDKMSYLAKVCDDVGLKDLFMTSMKIYTENSKNIEQSSNRDDEVACDVGRDAENIYGVLLHIDHMNDEKNYCKWIQKSCKSLNCNFLLRKHYPSNDQKRKPIIIVCLWGNVDAVKQMLKRWRTSRVDVDSRGNPCLERMMNVIVEGAFLENPCKNNVLALEGNIVEVTEDELIVALETIGGVSWRRSYIDSFGK